jgi:glutathione S-transferase
MVTRRVIAPLLFIAHSAVSLNRPSSFMKNIFGGARAASSGGAVEQIVKPAANLPTWDELAARARTTSTGSRMEEELALRERGDGPPHTDAKRRMFGTTAEPRVVYYRDTAAWCPYCQKVWILLEEKKIPYTIEKINMRSYGDKPPGG